MTKILYKLFLAAMIALFVGFGISVFYPAPKAPEYPSTLIEKTDPQVQTAEDKKVLDDYDKANKQYQTDFENYSRTVSAVAIGVSILLLVISLTILLPVEMFGDGILLGGLFTLFYGIIRAFMSGDNKFQFIVVTLGLIVALLLGYIKFIRPTKKISKA